MTKIIPNSVVPLVAGANRQSAVHYPYIGSGQRSVVSGQWSVVSGQ